MTVRMSCLALLLLLGARDAGADGPRPDPMLSVDMNRSTVVDRVVAQWSDRLAAEHAALPSEALREMLFGLRADHLLAASLAGSLEGLRGVLAQALTVSEPAALRRTPLKALGDTTRDLVYTPVVPCRIVDTRLTATPLQPGVPRVFDGYNASSFVFQGGTASGCGIPSGTTALALNVFAVNPTNLGLIKVWPQGQPEPDVSTVNYQPGIVALATGTIVPVNAANANRFNAQSPAQVDFIADVVGYFRSAQGNDGAVEIVVASGRAIRLEATASSPNIVEGSIANSVQSGRVGATIGGGGDSSTEIVIESTSYGCGASGCANRVLDPYGTVNGGAANTAGGVEPGRPPADTQDHVFATVGGGLGNVANARYGTVGGGTTNSVGAEASTVGGGAFNVINGRWTSLVHGVPLFGTYGVIAGGYGNSVSSAYGAIGGGYSNNIVVTTGAYYSFWPADFATIAGGRNNTVLMAGSTIGGGDSNLAGASGAYGGAYGTATTIGGGHANVTHGNHTTVSGGESNVAYGNASTVPGGSNNVAGGVGSLAAGTRAKVKSGVAPRGGDGHDGTFLWSDASDFDFDSAASNEFAARATGGVRFVTAIDGTTGVPTAGVYLAAGGGTWSSMSDRAAKRDLAPVDPGQVLESLAALPLYSWRYATETSGALHIGPTAQDFRAVFGLGDSERHIAAIDADGVALAAIQGLHRESRRKDAVLAAQRAIIDGLEARLRVLEAAASPTPQRD